mgnify:CR=1 FL=1
MEFTSGNFFIETIVPENELIVSRTDLKGNITYANDLFAQISGYTTNQLIGQAHNIVRHPDMPKCVFKDMWESVKSKGKWSGVVKNLRKDFGYYWVYAQISGVYKNDKLVEYKSIRSPITFEEKVKYQELYDQIRQDNNDLKRRVIYE